MANSAAAVRVDTPNFVKMCSTWLPTVFCEMCRARAMSRAPGSHLVQRLPSFLVAPPALGSRALRVLRISPLTPSRDRSSCGTKAAERKERDVSQTATRTDRR